MDSEPAATRSAPSQIRTAVEQFRIRVTEAPGSAISRPARSDVSVSSSLTTANRRTSWRSRTNARTTRMPAICSRNTRFMPSRRCCIRRNCGTMRTTASPTARRSKGTQTASNHDKPASSRTAITTPPTTMIGAATSNVHDTSTSI